VVGIFACIIWGFSILTWAVVELARIDADADSEDETTNAVGFHAEYGESEENDA